MRAILLVVGLLAAPVEAADQFDLVCISTTHAPVRYRINIATGEACSESCEQVWKMGPSTAGQLKIIDRKPIYRGDLEEALTVDRSSGKFRYDMMLGGHPESFAGECKPAPFTGFPEVKF